MSSGRGRVELVEFVGSRYLPRFIFKMVLHVWFIGWLAGGLGRGLGSGGG